MSDQILDGRSSRFGFLVHPEFVGSNFCFYIASLFQVFALYTSRAVLIRSGEVNHVAATSEQVGKSAQKVSWLT
jgi:hypothetical protein